jgi:hypothetical protein
MADGSHVTAVLTALWVGFLLFLFAELSRLSCVFSMWCVLKALL